jgi:hypothetical protein
VVAITVIEHLGKNGDCWPCLETLGQQVVARRTVIDALQRLERAGMLAVERSIGRPSKYRPVRPAAPVQDTAPVRGPAEPVQPAAPPRAARCTGPVRPAAPEQGKEQGIEQGIQNAREPEPGLFEQRTDLPARQQGPEDEWRMRVASEPWAQSLRRAGAKIGPKNWDAWKALVDRFGEPAVQRATRATSATARWPDQVEETLQRTDQGAVAEASGRKPVIL